MVFDVLSNCLCTPHGFSSDKTSLSLEGFTTLPAPEFRCNLVDVDMHQQCSNLEVMFLYLHVNPNEVVNFRGAATLLRINDRVSLSPPPTVDVGSSKLNH